MAVNQSAVQIRKATLDDAAISFAIRRESIRTQCRDHYPWRDLEIWTSGTMSQTFAQRVADHFHVAIIDECVVGTGMIDLVTGKIDAVFVLPGYLRRGVGRRLMDHLEVLAIEHGLRDIRLDATLNAAPFYRSLGYEGDQVAMYASSLGVSIACIPMIKPLRSDAY